MYLSRLYIKDFRSIAELDLSFQPGMNIIVGRNNAGKSNVIRALDIVLGESSPTYTKSELITEKDFRSTRTVGSDSARTEAQASEFFIWCELTRPEGEPLNFDELYGCSGFYVYSEISEWQGRKPIKRPIRIPRDALPQEYGEFFAIMEDENGEKDYINPKLRNQKTFEHQFEFKYCFAYGLRVWKQGDAINRDLRFFYRENGAKDWIMSFRATVRNELLQSAIIPAFRDPDRQLRPTSWTWYGKLLRTLTQGKIDSGQLREAFEEVRQLADSCFAEARDAINSSSLHVAFPDTELSFQFSADTRADLYKGCAIYVDDGQRSLLTEKGSGIQSAVIIGLFSYYTHEINTSASALLCIEEPELYLHPHAQRVISGRLTEFLAGGRNQVVLTTHSPEFISARTGLESITIVRRSPSGTLASTAALRDYRDLVLDLNQAELFFADGVIVCEGYDAYVLRAAAEELHPGALDSRNISIVSGGGKDALARFVGLVSSLGIRAYVLADFDYVLRDGNAIEAKQYGGTPHQNIFALGEAYFAMQHLLASEGSAAYRRLQREIAAIHAGDPRAFYTATRRLELSPPGVSSAAMNQLRLAGICVLDGQIEDHFRDPSVLHEGKFDREAVFRMNSALRSGRKASDLFDLEPLRALLARALG